jgi:hypothetical protein
MTTKEMVVALGVFLTALLGVVLIVEGCTSCTPTATLPAPDITITSSPDASPCAIADAISQARLIRGDGGMPMVIPCPP